jgi:hypothetical protein
MISGGNRLRWYVLTNSPYFQPARNGFLTISRKNKMPQSMELQTLSTLLTTTMRFSRIATSLLSIFVLSSCSSSHTRPFSQNGFCPQVPTEEVSHSVYLIGDTGELRGLQVIDDIKTHIANSHLRKDQTTVMFLGDNIYPDGMKKHADYAFLKEQIERLNTNAGEPLAEVTFLMGNHDWGGALGPDHKTAETQLLFLEELIPNHSKRVPAAGCPGPVSFDAGPFRIVTIDTQTWLTKDDLPTGCQHVDSDGNIVEASFLNALGSELTSSPLTILAAHHPIQTQGEHGGRGGFWRRAFYLSHLNRQDLNHSKYKHLRGKLVEQMKDSKTFIYASGHEHSLEVMENNGADFLLVSGSGSKTTPVGHSTDNSLFAYEERGFMVLSSLEDQSVWIQVVASGANEHPTDCRSPAVYHQRLSR